MLELFWPGRNSCDLIDSVLVISFNKKILFIKLKTAVIWSRHLAGPSYKLGGAISQRRHLDNSCIQWGRWATANDPPSCENRVKNEPAKPTLFTSRVCTNYRPDATIFSGSGKETSGGHSEANDVSLPIFSLSRGSTVQLVYINHERTCHGEGSLCSGEHNWAL